MDNKNYFRPGKKCGNWDTATVKAVLHLRSEECTTFTAMLLTLAKSFQSAAALSQMPSQFKLKV